MGEVAEMAGQVADLLDELLVSIEGLSMRLDALEASGELTAELEAEIVARIDRLRLCLAIVRESVDPTGAPLLSIKRRAKEKAGRMLASGVPADEIRSAFGELVDRLSWVLPEGQRPLVGPLVVAALDEVLGQEHAAGPG